mmetsp:Transcript_3834/g.5765  ORF Transcript_3834/g.5765 Transcript_3834/m.5765 type:complete len:129 (-) Transcript_3834:165-551(-)
MVYFYGRAKGEGDEDDPSKIFTGEPTGSALIEIFQELNRRVARDEENGDPEMKLRSNLALGFEDFDFETLPDNVGEVCPKIQSCFFKNCPKLRCTKSILTQFPLLTDLRHEGCPNLVERPKRPPDLPW